VELAPLPLGVVTLIGPLVAPLGTVVVILVSETTVNVAAVPLKFTLVAPVKLYPVMVTAAPTDPLVGENDVILGFTVKFVELVALPTVLVKVIRPVVAPGGATTASCVVEIPLKFVVVVPLKETVLVPVKLAPARVTVVATTPLAGENELIVGAAVEFTVKLAELVPAPEGVTTWTFPLVAPPGTLVLICASESTVNVAGVPLNDEVGSK